MKPSIGLILGLLLIIGYIFFESDIIKKDKISGKYISTIANNTSIEFKEDGIALWMIAGMPVRCKYKVIGNTVTVIDDDIELVLYIIDSDTLEAETKMDGMWIRE